MSKKSEMLVGTMMMLFAVALIIVFVTACGKQTIATTVSAQEQDETVSAGLGQMLMTSDVVEEVSDTGDEPYAGILTPFATLEEMISDDVEEGFPSAQLCVMKGNGEIVYSNAWGFAELYNKYGAPLPIEQRTRATTDTLYDIGGTSEVFTAWYAAWHLISIGELTLDTRVADVIGGHMNPQTTVEDLLRGTSGLPVGADFHKDTSDYYNGSGKRAVTYNEVCEIRPEIDLRTEARASDVDAVMLTFLVEEVASQRLDQYVETLWEQEFSESLRVTYNPLKNGYTREECAATEISGNTRFGLVNFPKARGDVICGEAHDETAYYAMEGISGNAGLFANAESLAKIMTTFLRPGVFSEEILDAMVTPTEINEEKAATGMAWYLEYEGDELVEYWLNSFTRCYVGVLPKADTVVVYLTNAIHSPLEFSSDEFEEYDLEHARFAGNYYDSAGQGILFQP